LLPREVVVSGGAEDLREGQKIRYKLVPGMATTPATSAAAQNLSFGPVIERILTGDASLDLDSGRVVKSLPTEMEKNFPIKSGGFLANQTPALDYMRQEGLDLFYSAESGLYADMKILTIVGGNWNELNAEQCLEMIRRLGPGAPLGAYLEGQDSFGFRTREGGMGLLQITGFTDNPHGVKLRYKLALPQSADLSARLAQVIHMNTNTAGFGPVVERMVNLEFGTNCAIDLDSGRLMDGRDDVEEQGADAIGFGDDFLTSSNQTASGLYCINETFAMTVNATNWDNGSADWVKSRADKLPFGVKQSELPLVTVMMMCSEDGELPNTYLFKTREGGRGILQITGFTETPPAVKIRYKLVLAQASPVPITSGRMLLPADRTQPSDEQIRHKIVGTWTVDGDPSRTIENKPDGSFVTHEGTELTTEGTWRVKDGFIVATITNASRPNATLEVESNKVVSIDDYKMVVLSIQGGTNVVTAHKR
jgi:hypothetical protein